MNDSFFTIDSGRPGPTLLVLGGVHGDEPCGVELVERTASEPSAFAPRRGKIVCALGNPAAIAAKKRFVTHNLNRLFLPSDEGNPCTCPEHERARQLRPLLRSADVLLDIHASYTPKSEPFLICERNALPIVLGVPVPTVCFGFDAVQPGGTDYFMNAAGKIGICVECGYLGDASNDIAERSLLAVMRGMGMADGDGVGDAKKTLLEATLLYVTRENFRVASPFADFDRVRRGEIIGHDGAEPVLAEDDASILFARDCGGPGEEAFVLLWNVTE